MQPLMRAIAQSLRNLGFSDATAGTDYVRVCGCEFWARGYRGCFTFCSRRYKTGNTLQATVDLIRELPSRVAQIEEAKKEKANHLAAQCLTKQLDDPDMRVEYNTYSRKFVFTYTSTDLTSFSTVVTRISNEMAAAAEQAWNEIVLESKNNTTFAKFTAEGGFSLN